MRQNGVATGNGRREKASSIIYVTKRSAGAAADEPRNLSRRMTGNQLA